MISEETPDYQYLAARLAVFHLRKKAYGQFEPPALYDHVVKLVEAGKLTKEGDSYVIELSKLGYNKLLGTGSISVKLIITAEHFSSRAEEKVKNAGGSIKSVSNSLVNEAEKSVEQASAE